MGWQEVTLIVLSPLLLGLTVATGIRRLFQRFSIIWNRDAMIYDLENIAFSVHNDKGTAADQVGCMDGFVVPSKLKITEHGFYSAGAEQDKLVLHGVSSYGYGTVTMLLDRRGAITGLLYSGLFR
jgi:hypothetical protein